VLVPSDQRIALERALAMANHGALDGRMFEPPATIKPVADGEPPVPALVVDDMVVPPLNPAGGGIER
jgi:hypothetical protein